MPYRLIVIGLNSDICFVIMYGQYQSY